MCRPKTCITWFCCFFLLGILTLIGYLIYARLRVKGVILEEDLESEDMDINKMLYKFQESAAVVNRLQKMKKIMTKINEEQYIFNYKSNSCLTLDTIIVIRVHRSIKYFTIFLESLQRASGTNASLLIFAHDYFDDKINSAIRAVKYAKVMQVFYPYSTQVFPNKYPGEDASFCHKLTECIDSRRRDPALVHSKLFWWWMINEVFDTVKLLRNYTGIVYFLGTEFYLSNDFVHMAKMLEQVRPSFCPDCQIVSLGAQRPRAEMYYPENSQLIVSIWGWSNYSNLGIGFNRTTFEEIIALRKYFCDFNDYSWENSLKYLALKTRHGHLYMLVPEGPRFFPLTGCGAFRSGKDCELLANYHDILGFLPKIVLHGRYSRQFKLKFNAWSTPNLTIVEPHGQWGDARDINLCMYFSSKERHEKF